MTMSAKRQEVLFQHKGFSVNKDLQTGYWVVTTSEGKIVSRGNTRADARKRALGHPAL